MVHSGIRLNLRVEVVNNGSEMTETGKMTYFKHVTCIENSAGAS